MTILAKRLWVDELEEGMKIAAPVMLGNQVFLNSQTTLDKKIILQLKNHAEILTILIEEEPRKKLTNWEKEVKHAYEETVQNVKKVFDIARETKEVPINAIVELTSNTLNNLLKENYVLQTLKNLNSHDEYTYHHSLNVGVLCGVLGKWLKYDKDTLFMLVLSGILHDIGKSQIPLEILNKPGKLTPDEFNIMKTHPILGFEMIKDISSIPDEVKFAVLYHHEKINGTGYPYGLNENEINDFAKIVAVVDTYDAVTSNRCYQKARSPFDVMEIIREEMFIRLDSKICLPMLSQIKISLLGRYVITEDGRHAQIIFIGSQTADDMILQTDDGELVALGLRDYKKFMDYLS